MNGNANALWWLGLIASVAVAVAAVADKFSPPWNEIAVLVGVAGAAINGYLLQRPRKEWTEAKREEHRESTGIFKLPGKD